MKLWQPQFYKDLTRKANFLRVTLGTRYGLEILQQYGKRVKTKVRIFWGLIPKFVKVAEKNW